MGHPGGEGVQQDDAGGQSRVDKVLANAAEHLLDHHNGHHTAKHGDEGVDGDGQVQRQQNAGDHAAEVAHGLGALHHPAAQVLAEDAGGHTGEDDHRRPEAEQNHRGHHGRHQGDDDVQHNVLGSPPAVKMGGGGDYQLFHITFSLPLSARSFCPGGWPAPAAAPRGRRRSSSRTPCRS